jgi:uncharacterized membrane protein YkoI
MKAIAVSIFALALAASTFGAGDKVMKMEELPPAVQKAIRAQVASTGATIKKTSMEVEDGKTNYECESILATGKKQDFDVSPAGKLGEIEDEVLLADVPAPVKARVDKARAAGGTIKELVSVTMNGKIVGYEVTVVKDGKKREIGMNPDGSPRKD